MAAAAFDSLGDGMTSPVIVSVPHAGRDYPPDILAKLAVPADRVRALEDRYVDRLADQIVEDGHRTIIARAPRLMIDLNRAETDMDPAHIAGRGAGGSPVSVKARGGLGLVPWQLQGLGRLWHRPIAPADLARRIAQCHRPYHQALSEAVNDALRHHGVALLIDLHSMPRLPGPDPASIVLGDRHGRTIAPHLANAAAAWLGRHHLRVARNIPYAGGHIIARHAAPERGIHALQIEIDRSLYLDAALDKPGPGAGPMARLIAGLVTHLAERIAPDSLPIAAE